MEIIFKLNGKTADTSFSTGNIWDTIEDWLSSRNFSPNERGWKKRAMREDFALFESCGILHDVFALRENNTMMVFIVAE